MIYKCFPQKIVIATNNKGKLKEIKAILSMPAVEFLSLSEAGASGFNLDEVYETYLENALLKAKKAAEITGLPTIADDSGLEVDALDGAPGVHSARFAGSDGDDESNIEKLLTLLKDVADENRTARFRCIAVAYFPEEDVYFTAEGVCEGMIIREKRGDKGFGYDPLFVPDGYKETFAELGEAVKNKISHRSKAFRLLRRKLIDFLEL